jgi:hypothetical protein
MGSWEKKLKAAGVLAFGRIFGALSPVSLRLTEFLKPKEKNWPGQWAGYWKGVPGDFTIKKWKEIEEILEDLKDAVRFNKAFEENRREKLINPEKIKKKHKLK